MKIAVVSAPQRGETDRLISEAARRLAGEGARLAGIVKVQPGDADHETSSDTYVRVLPGGAKIRITQTLGSGSAGCRLDPVGITEAVAAVEASGPGAADLFLLNKFGPEEVEGRGFRTAIGDALEHDVLVLLGVGSASREAFDEFSGGMAEQLPTDLDAILDWCRAAMALAPEAP